MERWVEARFTVCEGPRVERVRIELSRIVSLEYVISNKRIVGEARGAHGRNSAGQVQRSLTSDGLLIRKLLDRYRRLRYRVSQS